MDLESLRQDVRDARHGMLDMLCKLHRIEEKLEQQLSDERAQDVDTFDLGASAVTPKEAEPPAAPRASLMFRTGLCAKIHSTTRQHEHQIKTQNANANHTTCTNFLRAFGHTRALPTRTQDHTSDMGSDSTKDSSKDVVVDGQTVAGARDDARLTELNIYI
jgi:hypothetical protein